MFCTQKRTVWWVLNLSPCCKCESLRAKTWTVMNAEVIEDPWWSASRVGDRQNENLYCPWSLNNTESNRTLCTEFATQPQEGKVEHRVWPSVPAEYRMNFFLWTGCSHHGNRHRLFESDKECCLQQTTNIIQQADKKDKVSMREKDIKECDSKCLPSVRPFL